MTIYIKHRNIQWPVVWIEESGTAPGDSIREEDRLLFKVLNLKRFGKIRRGI